MMILDDAPTSLLQTPRKNHNQPHGDTDELKLQSLSTHQSSSTSSLSSSTSSTASALTSFLLHVDCLPGETFALPCPETPPEILDATALLSL